MSGRAVQLDGLRAIAMIGIAWDHWLPAAWPRLFPFEVFLFFFLVLTGYLITGSLLRERDRRDARGGKWKAGAMKTYQLRRGLRILAPYYAALAFAWIVRAPDLDGNMRWYIFHLTNIHIAIEGAYPGGTSHFWSLSMQQQFYLLWPFVVWFTPRPAMAWVFAATTAIAPVSRYFHSALEPWFAWPQKLTWMSFDYFGAGALLALAVHRGMSLESPALRGIAWVALAGYVYIFNSGEMRWPSFGMHPVQQTFLSVAVCGFIAAASAGFRGPVKTLLETTVLQRIGQLSYGIYLYHNLAPLAVGKIMPFLWNGHFDTGIPALFRISIFATITWLLALASWRWIEQPLDGVRSRLAPRPPPPDSAAGKVLKTGTDQAISRADGNSPPP